MLEAMVHSALTHIRTVDRRERTRRVDGREPVDDLELHLQMGRQHYCENNDFRNLTTKEG